MIVREMHIDDYDAIYALWNASLTSTRDISDSPEAIAQFLQRNPGLSMVAVVDGKIVGSVLCGHDGRRGVLYHVAVDASQRRTGVARAMVEVCLNKLREENIHKCGLTAFTNNTTGNAFWESMGFRSRGDVYYWDCWLNEN